MRDWAALCNNVAAAVAQCGLHDRTTRPVAAPIFLLFAGEPSACRNCRSPRARRCVTAARLSRRMRRLLHRAVDFQPDSGHAGRQAGRRALRAARRRPALPDLRPARAARVLFGAAAVGRDVRRIARRGARVAHAARSRDAACGRSRWRRATLACAVRRSRCVGGARLRRSAHGTGVRCYCTNSGRRRAHRSVPSAAAGFVRYRNRRASA